MSTTFPPPSIKESPFATDVREGLSAVPKSLSSKYFYDDAGSRIFQQIMELPEYYPTRAEMEILTRQPADIAAALPYRKPFNIIELGAGDGLKTKELLKYLVGQQADFTYMPIDISGEAMQQLEGKLAETLPGLKVKTLVGDYFEVLNNLDSDGRPNLYLFLGGNIGNYEKDGAINLLRMIRNVMQADGRLLTGFDLRKNPRIIQEAYDDAAGVTRAFNLNLLTRMNRELGADFFLDQFDFYSFYNPRNGEVRSMLVSLSEQDVYFKSLNQSVHFQKNELIHTELSKKYTLTEIDALAAESGFVVERNFFDSQHYFTDSLWQCD
ncbi:L-histidine N(alpha)-methyltransferase [Persicitalea jodogahamensis]|uniref:L-histidine N(alpha)-methyltransferase n=1 Tax=Persicitalea jodogahamensis TaxID=402147 RepID=UPI001673C6E4|nr:L-histidine N(alpha)-methyltransferase [Persicitalea jodogahamensis]